MNAEKEPTIDDAVAAAQAAIVAESAANGANPCCCVLRRVDVACLMVSVFGEVDSAEAEVVTAAIDAVRTVRAVELLIVDLTGVMFFGSRGIAMLVRAQAASPVGGTDVGLIGISNRAVRRPLQATGLLEQFSWLATNTDSEPADPGR
ncbi:hypothetical protein GCM10009836_04310 [Pseudonocardia ailaonensis]|uniref:STAS domain-containing protein n=1 Tax=Pseudonocardia ailaonensis TaxID=367279 RepID=A0ABN2MK30_9PSEU